MLKFPDFWRRRSLLPWSALLVLATTTSPLRTASGQPSVPPDSLAPQPDTTSVAWSRISETAVARAIPARVYAFELTEMLGDEPASFLYDLGPHGWPHGWSPAGLSPQHVGLAWNGFELHDLFTGRPLYEALPLNSARIPLVVTGRGDRLTSVALSTRSHYEESRQPLTELTYHSSNNGLQKVFALHSQTRSLSRTADSRVNLLFSYGGEGADGEYPGSRVKQGRQLYGRLKYTGPGWTLELGDLYNKRATGAHGGVLPRSGSDFESVYQRLGATVLDPDAIRQTRRNDAFATLKINHGTNRARVTEASAALTTERFGYRRPGDTLTVRSTRLAGRLSHTVTRASYRLAVEASGSSTTARPRSSPLDFEDTTDSRLVAAATGRTRLAGFETRLRMGLEVRKEGSAFLGQATIERALGPARLKVEASQVPTPVSLLDRTGLGPHLRPPATIPLRSSRRASASLSVAAGPFDMSVLGSVLSDPAWIDYFATENRDSVIASVQTTALQVVAAGLDLGFRRRAERGIYFTAQPSVFGMANSDTEAESRYAESVPAFSVVARLGVRYLLFRDDLDLDASVRARFWSEFRGRSLHTQSGLLALASPGSRPVESSTAVDFIVTGGIRTATLFVVYENFLSGTSLIPGNLLVPVYPLPEKRIRFGVFWPIMN